MGRGHCEVSGHPAMKAFLQIIKRSLGREPKLHPLDGRIAKRWIKQRLVACFPELRNNPAALERAYQALDLDARPGVYEGEPETVFEIRFHQDEQTP